MKRTNKYHAQRVGPYDSKAEAEYGEMLVLLGRAGEITDFVHKPPAVEIVKGTTWRLDFLVLDSDGREIYVDVKGFATAEYKLKLNLWKNHVGKNLIVVQRESYLHFRVIDSHWPGSISDDLIHQWPYADCVAKGKKGIIV